MKCTDFNLEKEMKLDPETGIATFKGTRLVIFDANAVGLLRQNLLEKVGWEVARDIVFRFGFQHGYSDCIQMKVNYEFDTDMDWLASGPVIHTWEGIVKATPTHIEFDRATGHFYFTGVWSNSYEAEQFLSFNPVSKEPVCWSLSGYASGWCSAFFGSPILTVEPCCVGMGHDHCEWKLLPVDKWGPEAKPYVDIVKSMLGGGRNG